MRRSIVGVFALVAGLAPGVEAAPPAPAAPPVYYLHDQRIWRAEADGSGRRELALAYGTAVGLAVAPRTGRLAFADMSEGDGHVCIATNEELLRRTPLPKDGGRVEALRWSPQGGRVSILLDGGGSPSAGSIHLLYADSGGLEPLRAEGRGDRDPTWSPDGTSLAVVAVTRAWEEPKAKDYSVLNWDAAIEVVNVQTRTRCRLVEPTNRLHSAAWSPDGATIAYASITDVYVVPAKGGKSTSIHKGNISAGPLWSPDGKRILVTLPRLPLEPTDPEGEDAARTEVVTFDADGRNRRSFDVKEVRDLAYAPDGQALALLLGADRVVRVPLSGENAVTLAQRAPWKPTDERVSILTEVVWAPRR